MANSEDQAENLLNAMLSALEKWQHMVSMSREETTARKVYEAHRAAVLDVMRQGSYESRSRVYQKGVRDMESRMRNRPGDGDMGG